MELVRPLRFPSDALSLHALRLALRLALAAAIAIGIGVLIDREWADPTIAAPIAALDPGELRPGFGARTFADELALVERDLDGARRSLALAPDEWIREESVARALIARYRLTGSYADLAAADQLLDDAIARTDDPAGPILSRAALSLTVHRLDQAGAALARARRWVIPTAPERAELAVLAGDIAAQRGSADQAQRDYSRAAAIAPSSGITLRQAITAASTGERETARLMLDGLIAAPRQSPRALAELSLHRASLAYAGGDIAEAGRWIGAANQLFPGYWLAHAYAAQQRALSGDTAAAAREYAEIAERSQAPEVMDALAHLQRLQGNREASGIWAARAASAWQARLRLFPEAAYQHAAEHELALGDPQRALALARADYAHRRDALTTATLARALLLTGQPRAALAAIDAAQRRGWRTTSLATARFEAEGALGRTAAAENAAAAALALNPRAFDPETRMIWFGHD